jgi:hypothetical protein
MPHIVGSLGQLLDNHMTAHSWCRLCNVGRKINLNVMIAQLGRDWVYVGKRWPIKCRKCGSGLGKT